MANEVSELLQILTKRTPAKKQPAVAKIASMHLKNTLHRKHRDRVGSGSISRSSRRGPERPKGEKSKAQMEQKPKKK